MYIAPITIKPFLLYQNRRNLVEKPLTAFCSIPDTFERTSEITFQAGTAAGNPLKKLRGIKCPYFGVEMISASEITRAERKLDQCTTLKEFTSVLSKYSKNMLPVEKKMYKRFRDEAKIHPNTSLSNCLRKWYDEALVKLKLEEFNVLDDIDKISLKMSPQNALAVHANTTMCRQIILENNAEDTFKRKNLLSALNEIVPKRGEKEIYEKMNDRALYLPTSGTSENAFVIKYANRSSEEIAKRLIRPSVATIEHIHPRSLNGEDTISNFMLACSGANSARSSMPLPLFIERYPHIPKHSQNYVKQIIDAIHKGQLKGQEQYPYQLKKSLLKESNSLINLDITGYKYSKREAKNISRNKRNRFR